MKLNLQCYVINLDRSPDRLNNMEARLANMPFEWQRISAVDGSLLPELLSSEVDERNYERCHGKPIARAEVGCYLSHIRALKVFLQSANEYALILEDDAFPADDFPQVLYKLLSITPQWDVVKLSGFHRAYPIKCIELDGKYKLGVPLARHCNTAALLYNRVAAHAVLETLLPMSLPFDHALEQPWLYGGKMRIVTPSPVAAGDGTESTITTTANRSFVWYKRLSTYLFRIRNELKRFKWAWSQK
ncbi:MAG: hypothetical protein H6R05_1687 [Burkholderiaceae bacterium]|nr:hypothetical protein [Burkholderiaceae bacterium]